jgi:hypothetical protein
MSLTAYSVIPLMVPLLVCPYAKIVAAKRKKEKQ